MSLFRTVMCCALLALVGLPSAAHAVDAKAQAGQLYKEGVELFKAKKFAEARAKFQAAYNLDPAQNLLYNLARAAEEMGDAEAAVGHYQAYIIRFPKAEDRAEVERRVRVLEAVLKSTKVGTLVVLNVPPNAKLQIDGRDAPAPDAPGQWKLPVGQHTLKVLEPGKPPVVRRVTVQTAQSTTFDYTAATTAPKPPAKPTDPVKTSDPVVKKKTTPETPPEEGFWTPMTISGVSAVGVGAALLGAGGYFFAQASANADDYNSIDGSNEGDLARRAQAKDDFESNGSASTLLFISGAVILAGGVGVLATDYVLRDGWAVVPTANGFGIAGTF